MQQLANVVQSLRKEGFRITPQRIAIVDYVIKTDTHPTAEQIHHVIQKKYPMVSLSTVYKTLDLLKKKRLVQEIEFDGGSRYDGNTDDHVNVICLRCGKIDDVKEDSIPDMESRVKRKSKYKILTSSFELYGYCESCKNKVN